MIDRKIYDCGVIRRVGGEQLTDLTILFRREHSNNNMCPEDNRKRMRECTGID